MKIDFYISSLSGGGAEKVLVTIANKLAELGNSVSIISLEMRPQFYVPNQDVNIIKIKNTGKLSWLKDLFRIRKYMNSSNAEVSISFLTRCNLLVLFLGLFTSKKIIVSDRNNPLKEHSKFIFLLQNLLYLRANQIIVQTQQIKSYYWKALKNKITVIENPIDTVALNNQIKKVPKRENVILSMGRLEKQKDFKSLIKAFSLISDKHPDWRVEVFGFGNMQKELQEYVSSFNLSNKFLFRGRTATPYYEMKRASIFVLSSFYEGFPNVLCEALYAGDLCISSDCVSGPREMIDHGENGWLFGVGNSTQLADILDYCIKNNDMLNHIRNNAQESVKGLYLEKNIKKWVSTIEKVIDN